VQKDQALKKTKNIRAYQDRYRTCLNLLIRAKCLYRDVIGPTKKVILNACSFKLFLEFMKIAQACALGFAVMGVVGYVIKLVFIPINNIILT